MKIARTTVILLTFGVLVIGGIGGVLMERIVLPVVSDWPFFRHFPIISPRSPLLITRREEIRINEGINYAEIVNRLKNNIVTIYIHEKEFGSPKFSLVTKLSGAVVSSDGVIVSSFFEPKPDYLFTVLTSSSVYQAKLLATDHFSGLALFRVETEDLPVIRQGFSRELGVGERLLLLASPDSPEEPLIRPMVVQQRPLVLPNISVEQNFAEINGFISIDFDGTNPQYAGAVLLNKDGQLVGVVSKIAGNHKVLRSEDLKLVLDNFLDDGEIVWPKVNLRYVVLGENEATLFNLPRKYGILVNAVELPLEVNDFIRAVDGKELSPEEDFQRLLLEKKPGDTVRLGVIRGGKETIVEFKL